MYCAYVTRIHNLRKHTNADRLLCGECFGNTVIVDLGTDPDQLGVYFPTRDLVIDLGNSVPHPDRLNCPYVNRIGQLTVSILLNRFAKKESV